MYSTMFARKTTLFALQTSHVVTLVRAAEGFVNPSKTKVKGDGFRNFLESSGYLTFEKEK